MNRTINVGGNQGRGDPPFAPRRSPTDYSALTAIFSAIAVIVAVTFATWGEK